MIQQYDSFTKMSDFFFVRKGIGYFQENVRFEYWVSDGLQLLLSINK